MTLDIEALIGACAGAAFVATYTQTTTIPARITAFINTVIIAYVLTPELLRFSFFSSHSAAAFAIAIAAIPLLVKISKWLENSTLTEILGTIIRNRKE